MRAKVRKHTINFGRPSRIDHRKAKIGEKSVRCKYNLYYQKYDHAERMMNGSVLQFSFTQLN